MEHVFQEERKNLHDFLDDLPVGLYTCTRDFQIEYANHAFARIVGVAREDLIGTDFRKYLGENVETPQNTTWSGRLFLSAPHMKRSNVSSLRKVSAATGSTRFAALPLPAFRPTATSKKNSALRWIKSAGFSITRRSASSSSTATVK